MSQQMYTTAELQAMTPEELSTAQARGFVKPPPVVTADLTGDHLVVPENEQKMGEAIFGPDYSGPSMPSKYAITTWGSDLYDFRVPSGQLCQMRKLRPEKLIETGLLDKITRLPGLVEVEVRKAEGLPPQAAIPDAEQLKQVVAVVNPLMSLVVVQPQVCADDVDPLPQGAIHVSDIELFDRIAIMNRATQGVAKLDNFREQP